MVKRPSKTFLLQAKDRVEPALTMALDRASEHLTSDGPVEGHVLPDRLLKAMKYSVLSPGKRLRPALVFGAARAVGAAAADVLPAACAVEMVHAYSLIHDDLPALDDDDFRRGKPSCHRKFDEATAVLAGDALLTEAFALMADGRPLGRGKPVPPSRRTKAMAELARAVGAAGMVGGQHDDVLEIESTEQLTSIHRRKTGRLIQAAVALGGIYGSAGERQTGRLRRFGAEIGLAFQLVDDTLDGDGIAAIAGEDEARAEARTLTESAIEALSPFGRSGAPLRALAALMVERRK